MILGIIGGSGMYDLGGTWAAESIDTDTPFGKPSGPVIRVAGKRNTLLFLARHGEGHRLTPTEVNYRANVFALKKLGAKALVSVSAVGSMREQIEPGDMALPDQYVDLTRGIRPHSYFGEGVVAHAPMAKPTCASLRQQISSLLESRNCRVHAGGTYVCIEGPQFSTRAESDLYRSWPLETRQVVVIGMTAMPEARLAREAGLCYQTVAMATDFDCWNESGGEVSVDEVLRVMAENVEKSRRLAVDLADNDFKCVSGCNGHMRHSVITPRERWPRDRMETLSVILGE